MWFRSEEDVEVGRVGGWVGGGWGRGGYLLRFDMAEHGDLLFDRVLQRCGAATHDLLAATEKQEEKFAVKRATEPEV